MFERFDESARLAIVRAQEQARQLNHGWVGTEHLLLGVMGVGGSVSRRARRALTVLGVGLDDVRGDVEAIIARGAEPPPAHAPFTPRAEKILELSAQEARQLSHEFVSEGQLMATSVTRGSVRDLRY